MTKHEKAGKYFPRPNRTEESGHNATGEPSLRRSFVRGTDSVGHTRHIPHDYFVFRVFGSSVYMHFAL